MRFSSLRYFSRASCILCAGARFCRASFASKFISSSSSYGIDRKFLSSLGMNLLEVENTALVLLNCFETKHLGARVSRRNSNRQIQNHFPRKETLIGAIKKSLVPRHSSFSNAALRAGTFPPL